jgi:hypothetical protein
MIEMDQQQVDELRAIYEGMSREELIENAILAAHAMQEAEELIEELRADIATLDAAASSHPESLAAYDDLLHGSLRAA